MDFSALALGLHSLTGLENKREGESVGPSNQSEDHVIVVENGLDRRWALRKTSDDGVPSLSLWVINVMEEKLSVGQGARNRDGTKVEKFGRDGRVVLETGSDDQCMDFLKPSETVTAL